MHQLIIAYLFVQADDPFCVEESDLVGDYWPNSPGGDTVLNTTCAEGRVGYKSRTCVGTTWQPVFYYCVNEQLGKINLEAYVSMAKL